jgi:hypothetical protein
MHVRRFLLLFLLLSAFAAFAHADGAGLDPHGIRGASDAGARIDDNG